MAWAPLAAGTDVQSAAATDFLGLLWVAAESRRAALQTYAPLTTAPTAGADIQRNGLWNIGGGAGSATDGLLYRVFELLTPGGSTLYNWLDFTRTADFGDPAAAAPLNNGFPVLDIDAARSAASLPKVKIYTGGQDPFSGAYTPLAAGTDGGVLFRRQRYREVYTLSAVCDVHGNAATAGQRAFLLESFVLVNPGTGVVRRYSGVGQRVRCVASGNWVRDESAQADLLDSTVATPGWCSRWANGNLSIDPNVFPGDVLKSVALLNEIWGLLDVMRWTRPSFAVFSGNEIDYNTANYPTLAAVRADAAAAWGGLAANPTTLAYSGWKTFNGGPGSYRGEIASSAGTWSPNVAMAASKKKAQFWLRVVTFGFQDVNSALDNIDAQGTTLDTSRLGKFWHWAAADTAATTATAPATPAWGDLTAPPANMADPTAAPVALEDDLGYAILDGTGGSCVVAKWNVDPANYPCSVTS